MADTSTSSSPAERATVRWVCQRCTACCRWPGDVKVDDGEIADLARFLGMSEETFIQRYTRLRRDRRGLSLIDRDDDGACIFLEGPDCRIKPVKPAQCRGFPNDWNFPGWRHVCEAIPVAVSADPASGQKSPCEGRRDNAGSPSANALVAELVDALD